MTEAFKKQVHEYCSIDEKIKESQAESKELKKQMADLGEQIIQYMSNQNLEVCNAGELGVLTILTSTTKSSLKKENIRDGIFTFMNDSTNASLSREQFAENGADFIMNNRETEERKRLKRKKVK
jgi:hypothetical protein|tara:strand:+ start:37 stop:408 length:372 start_codon:yes stop_codon:yes gene_type:complete